MKLHVRPFVIVFTLLFLSRCNRLPEIAELRKVGKVDKFPKYQKKENDFLITDYGAVGDGSSLNTQAIQDAIDAASLVKGRVIVPPGAFLTGSIFLKDNVELHLLKDAVLLGSTDWKLYSKERWYALILAKGKNNIAISGKGTIDGQGAALAENVKQLVIDGVINDVLNTSAGRTDLLRANEKWRPQIIEFTGCSGVKVSGITLRNSSGWLQNYRACNDVEISKIMVDNVAYWNNDGVDISDSKHVKIHDCEFDIADDGVCLKSESKTDRVEDVEVWNCKIRSSASAFKCGTASVGGFKNVRVHDLYVYNTLRTAIALEMVDGGVLEDFDIYNIEAVNTGGSLFIRLGKRNPAIRNPPSALRHVHIHHTTTEVAAGKPDEGYPYEYPVWTNTYNRWPSSISGLADLRVEDVVLDEVKISSFGGKATGTTVSEILLDGIPERPSNYPEFTMFGELPAWGLYARHIDGLTIKNSQLSFRKNDFRGGLVCDDVSGLNLENVAFSTEYKAFSSIYLRNVTNESLTNVQGAGGFDATITRY